LEFLFHFPFCIKDRGQISVEGISSILISDIGATPKKRQGEGESRCRLFKRMV